MGSLYRSQHELVFVFKTGPAATATMSSSDRFGRNRSNLWRLSWAPTRSGATLKKETFWHCTRPQTGGPRLPMPSSTAQSVARWRWTLSRQRQHGDRRRADWPCLLGLELDPLYVDTIIRRWQALTGGNARHAVSGRSFDGSRPRSVEVGDADDRDQELDYEVGYGRPPQHTRFKPGCSGNPRGRPKDAKNLSTLVREALNEPVVVTDNGRRRK